MQRKKSTKREIKMAGEAAVMKIEKKSATPDVAVLMRIRDGIAGYPAGSLKRAVDSALNQPSIRVEVIAVDNGSRDTTGEFLASYDDPRVKIVTLAENVGEAEALNVGCENATARYCIQLTARSWYEADCLAQLVRTLDEAALVEDLPVRGFAFGAMEVHGEIKRYHRPPPWHLQEYAREFRANFFMFRREAYSEHGLRFMDYLRLDDGSPVGICDRDFMMQMVNLGWSGIPLPEVKVINYEYTGKNQMSSLVQQHRREIDAAYRNRWGAYL